MKAEDTVIKLDKVSNVSLRIAMESILLEQAEITWDKAYKAGQKEVVKQIREHAINAKRNASEVYEAHKQLKPRDNQAKIRYGGYDSALQDLISYLQAKLKELGNDREV